MNPKTKKGLIIAGLSLDALITVGLFVLSIVLLVMTPKTKYDIPDLPPLVKWFCEDPIRILICVVIPLAALLIANIIIFYTFMKKGAPKAKKEITLDDLSEEEKEALKKKIAEELLNESKK